MSFSDNCENVWEIKSDSSSSDKVVKHPRKCIHMKYCGDVVKNFHLLLVGTIVYMILN